MTYKNIRCIIFNVEYGGGFVIRLLVLWLLDNESMSGYDIKQMLQTMDAKRWGGVLIGSIYYALKKLEKNGYICVTDMEQAQYRPRVTYSITQKGKKYLRTLKLTTPISNGGLILTPPGYFSGSAKGGGSQYHFYW